METETKPTTGFRKYCHIERQGHRNTRGIEEMVAILRRHKNATIDFQRMNYLTTAQIKATLPELF